MALWGMSRLGAPNGNAFGPFMDARRRHALCVTAGMLACCFGTRALRLLYSLLVITLILSGCGGRPATLGHEIASSGQRSLPPPSRAFLWPDDAAERTRVPVAGAPRTGAEQPLVSVVLFGAYECEFTRLAQASMDRILERHPGVAVYFRHSPRRGAHRGRIAAMAAEAARELGGDEGFWKLHRLLLEHGDALAYSTIRRLAQDAGMDADRIAALARTATYDERIERDTALAGELGALYSPHVFINGRQVVGAQSYEVLEEIVQDELRTARKALRLGTRIEDVYEAAMRQSTGQPSVRFPFWGSSRDLAAHYNIPIDGAPTVGPEDALLKIVMFLDYSEPFFGVYFLMTELAREYGAALVIKFRTHPDRPESVQWAKAMLAAHALLDPVSFQENSDFLASLSGGGEEDLKKVEELVVATGISPATYRSVLESEQVAARIRQDADSLMNKPSAVYVNGRDLTEGAPELEQQVLLRIMDDEKDLAEQLVREGVPRRDVYHHLTRFGAETRAFVFHPNDPSRPPSTDTSHAE